MQNSRAGEAIAEIRVFEIETEVPVAIRASATRTREVVEVTSDHVQFPHERWRGAPTATPREEARHSPRADDAEPPAAEYRRNDSRGQRAA